MEEPKSLAKMGENVYRSNKDWLEKEHMGRIVALSKEGVAGVGDLSEHLPDASNELKVRVSFTAQDKIDFIGLDTGKQGEFSTHTASLASAVHISGTNLKEALMSSDNIYAELYPDEQIQLDFTLPQTAQEQRDFIIILEGHYNQF